MQVNVARVKIGDAFDTEGLPVETSFRCRESFYTPAVFQLRFVFIVQDKLKDIIKALDTTPTIQLQWGVGSSDQEVVWSEWRYITVLNFYAILHPDHNVVIVRGTDQLRLMAKKCSALMINNATVPAVLDRLKKIYNFASVQTDAQSDVFTARQCQMTDKEFVETVLIPKARERLVNQGHYSDFLFYVQNGSKLVVRTRKSEGPVYRISNQENDSDTYATSIITSVVLGDDSYATKGRGLDLASADHPFRFREFKSDELGLLYDAFPGTQTALDVGPDRIEGLPVWDFGANTVPETQIKGHMSRPKLFTRYRVSIPLPMLPGFALGDVIELQYDDTPFNGKYLLYQLFTQLSPSGGFTGTVVYVERAKHG